MQPTPCLNAGGAVIAPKVFVGHSIPTAEGSFTSTVRFLKNFSVYAMADYATGYKRLDDNLRIRWQIFYIALREVARSLALVRCALEHHARAGEKSGGFTVSARNLHTWTPYTGQGFVLNVANDATDNRLYNRIDAVTQQFGDYTIEDLSRDLKTEKGESDPRSSVKLTTTRAADARSPIYVPNKCGGGCSTDADRGLRRSAAHHRRSTGWCGGRDGDQWAERTATRRCLPCQTSSGSTSRISPIGLAAETTAPLRELRSGAVP